MPNSNREYKQLFKVAGYILVLFVLQTYLVAHLPYRALRVDLLFPAMVGVALVFPSKGGIWGAFLCGYIMDVLSGKFWGLHVGTYVIVVCLVQMSIQKIEFNNPFYQMSFILLCVLVQSFILGLFLWAKAPSSLMVSAFMKKLIVRSLITTIIAPLVISPFLRMR